MTQNPALTLTSPNTEEPLIFADMSAKKSFFFIIRTRLIWVGLSHSYKIDPSFTLEIWFKIFPCDTSHSILSQYWKSQGLQQTVWLETVRGRGLMYLVYPKNST